MNEYLGLMTRLGLKAGDAILKIYEETDFGIETKPDNSPLTKADLAAHKIIVEGLVAEAPDIPVLSEESAEISWEERSSWRRYFLVDPLDGTKEFISGNGEFTVNIAYIENCIPVAGIVYVPVKKVLYRADRSIGMATVTRNGEEIAIRSRRMQETLPLTIVASRRHGGEALEALVSELNQYFPAIETTNMGSSLKLCLIAEGEADLYPRLAPTCEWDTAAAQAIVEAAGGLVVDNNLKPMRYNTKADLLNKSFYVFADREFDWTSVLSEIGAH